VGTSGRFIKIAIVELYGDIICEGDIDIVYDGSEVNECIIRIKCV
jgi:hypothetical protein